MYMLVRVVLVLALLVPNVLGAQPPKTSGTEQILPGSRGPGWVWTDPVADLAPDAVLSSHISRIIYINDCIDETKEGGGEGCVLKPGVNDARANTSTLVSGTPAILTQFPHGKEVWDATIACIRDVYSPYNVEIVTEDPGTDVLHHEAILAGRPQQLGLDATVGGIAPANCSALNNVISFSFADTDRIARLPSVEDMATEMCWTVAQESAHAFGLPNHVFNCLDPMTYREGCGKKYFRNKTYECGTFQPEPCICAHSGQNSHAELQGVFGDGVAPPPPTVSIGLPKPDARVEDKFSVIFNAIDPRLVDRSEVWVNGVKVADLPGHGYDKKDRPYSVEAPPLPDGLLDIEVRSYNDLGSEGIATVTVVKGEPCQTASTCFDFQECSDGRCVYPAPTASLGEACEIEHQCIEGICASVDDGQGCALPCAGNVEGACVKGYACTPTNTGGFACWPEENTGGCCSVAGTKGDPIPWHMLPLFAFVFWVVRGRVVSAKR